MVGDTVFDCRMAKAAGSPFLWFGTQALALPPAATATCRRRLAGGDRLFDEGRP